MVELETDKVTVEVAAPASGVMREILKGENEELAPGDVLARMEAGAVSGPTTQPAARPCRSVPTSPLLQEWPRLRALARSSAPPCGAFWRSAVWMHQRCVARAQAIESPSTTY